MACISSTWTTFRLDAERCVHLHFCRRLGVTRTPSRFSVQWPAAWTTAEKNWPYTGEIDVIEGANALPANTSTPPPPTNAILAEVPSKPPTTQPENQNVVSLHTGPSCPLQPLTTDSITGKLLNGDCSGLSDGNVGCGVEIPGKSFGAGFNANGGGVYAMWRDLKK